MKESNGQTWNSREPFHRVLPIVAAALLLLAVVADFGLIKRDTRLSDTLVENAKLVPADFHNAGLFTLEGVEGLSAAYIYANLQFTPALQMGFTVEKASAGDGTAKVQVRNPQRTAYDVTLAEPFRGRVLNWTIPSPPLELSLLTTATNNLKGPIKLYASEPISRHMMEKSISFSPKAEFRASMHGTTISIVPDYPLEPNTNYTIHISHDIQSENGNTPERACNFTLRTGEGVKYITETLADVKIKGSASIMATPDTPTPLEFESENLAGDTPVTITTYRFPDMDKYVEQAQLFVDYGFDPAEILEKADVTLGVLKNGTQTIEIPGNGAGGYLVEAVVKNPLYDKDKPGYGEEFLRVRKAMFVSGLSVYMQSMNGQTLAWVNSAVTGEPLGGYTVEFLEEGELEPFASATTDAGGVAMVDRRKEGPGGEYSYDFYGYEDAKSFVLRLRDPSGAITYVDASTIIAPAAAESGGEDKYYSFFYTDRAIYKPTDEINFWGYVKGRSANSLPLPSTVEVRLGGLDVVATVPIDGNGSFYGKLNYESIKSSQYDLAAYLVFPASADELNESDRPVDEPVKRQFEYAWIDVKDYDKPLFKIQSETDKDYYVAGDTVKVHITPQFFDGTPLPNYTLELSTFDTYYGEESGIQIITTDETGVAVAEFEAAMPHRDAIGWLPMKTRYKVKIASDGQDITHYGNYILFPTDRMVTAEVEKQPGGNLAVNVATNDLVIPQDLDIAEIENRIYTYGGTSSYYYRQFDYDRFVGPARDMTVTAAVNYEYRDRRGFRHADTRTVSITTENGVGNTGALFGEDFDPTKPYWVDYSVIFTDRLGNSIGYSDYHSYYPRGWREEGDGPAFAPGYAFEVTDGSGENRTGEYYEYMTYSNSTFSDREQMNFDLMLGGAPVSNEGRILYTLLQNGVISRGVTTENRITLTQNVNWAQSVTLCAAYFDGREVFPIRDTVIDFDLNSLDVNIEVEADKASYQPGDTVRISVTATEAESGAPVQGNALVSVVDEAVFALREQYISVIGNLFGDMYFYNYFIPKYTTTTGDVPYPGGGDGGKGGDEMADFYNILRKNFKDTAAFLPVRTGVDGKAAVSFTLPDNLTSWRITAVSIGDNLYGGDRKYNIISTLPFFMQPVCSSKYIEGDEIAMLVQGHGTLLKEGGEIGYSVQLTGDGFDKTITDHGTAYEARPLNFGKLPQGEYTLSATATYLGYSDTVELPLYVIPSNLELVVNKPIDLSKPLDIKAMRYPVTLSFYDQEHEAYFSSISSLLTHYCMIANQRMSRFVAKRALTKYMDEADIPQHIRQGNESATDMQNEDGGIGWYPGDPSDPVLTAKVLLVADDQFNRASMTQYFADILATHSRLDAAAAHLGLAALGMPQTEKIEELLGRDTTSGQERAYLIAALAYGGESDLAKHYYDQYLAPLRVETKEGVYFRQSTVSDRNRVPKNGGYVDSRRYEEQRLTAAAWIAASRLGLADADGVSLYFAKDSWRIDTLFEGMIYVTNYSKEITPTTFTYHIGDEAFAVNLGVGGQKSIALNRTEMDAFRIDGVPANVRSTAYYIGEPGEVEIEPSELIQISKRMTKLPEGDRYQINIDVKLLPGSPEGDYDISEWIPSNMRLYKMMINDVPVEDYWWNFTQEGQKLRFHVWRSSRTVKDETIRISYIAQKTYDSVAVVDSTYIIHGNSGENAFTERYVLEE